MACYLEFDVASLGTLFFHWSEEPVEGALAVIHPGKPVPKFKFKQRGGKSEIIRNIREDKKRLYMGWVEFIKMAKSVDGKFELLEPREVTLAFNQFGTVVHVLVGEPYDVNDFSSVAVCGKDADPYMDVKTMPNGQFMGIGLRQGYALAL